MTDIETKEATWTCPCPSEHRPTIGRAWCFACTEWCYPGSLCVRGERDSMERELEELRAELESCEHDRTELELGVAQTMPELTAAREVVEAARHHHHPDHISSEWGDDPYDPFSEPGCALCARLSHYDEVTK